MKNSSFKSEASRDQFRSHYRQVLSQLPFGQQFIKTSLGQTFMLTAGQEINPPVILLHGSCSNSAFWYPEIMSLSGSYRVYAVDIIGEAGNSEEYRPDIDSDAFAVWLKEVLDALNLPKAVVIGNSLGGWMSLKFATSFPERVSKLVLIASAGLAEIRPQFSSKVPETLQKKETVPVVSSIIGGNDIPKEVLDFLNLIIRSYNPIQYLPVFTDKQLQRLNMPVLFLDGENDVIVDAAQSAQRLSALIPSVEINLIENCSHFISNSAEIILPFLKK